MSELLPENDELTIVVQDALTENYEEMRVLKLEASEYGSLYQESFEAVLDGDSIDAYDLDGQNVIIIFEAFSENQDVWQKALTKISECLCEHTKLPAES